MVYKKKTTFQANSQTSGKQYMLIRGKAPRGTSICNIWEFAFSDFANPAVCMNFIINRVTNHKNLNIQDYGLPFHDTYWTS